MESIQLLLFNYNLPCPQLNLISCAMSADIYRLPVTTFIIYCDGHHNQLPIGKINNKQMTSVYLTSNYTICMG